MRWSPAPAVAAPERMTDQGPREGRMTHLSLEASGGKRRVALQTALGIGAGRSRRASAGSSRNCPEDPRPQEGPAPFASRVFITAPSSQRGAADHERRGEQPVAGPPERNAVVRVRVHARAGHGLPPGGALPALPLHLCGGPAGEHAGHLGQLAAAPRGQRRPLLHHQHEPVGPDGGRRPALLHDGGDHGQGLAVGPLPLQGDQPGVRGELLQQLLLPGPHDPGALPVPDATLQPRPLPSAGPPPLGALRRPVGLLAAAGADGERPRGPAGVGRAGLLHDARVQLHGVVRRRGVPLPALPVPGPRRRHHHLQRAHRPSRQEGAGRAGAAGRVAGARVLAGVRPVLAALPRRDGPDDRGRLQPVRAELQHDGGALLLVQRGAEPLALPLRGQPHPLQLPQQELPRQPDQRRGEPHTQGGGRAPGGRRGPARRAERRRGGPREATQVEQRQHQPVRRGFVRRNAPGAGRVFGFLRFHRPEARKSLGL